MPAQSWVLNSFFEEKIQNNWAIKHQMFANGLFFCSSPFEALSCWMEKRAAGKKIFRQRGLDGLIRCCWEAVASETSCFRFLVYLLFTWFSTYREEGGRWLSGQFDCLLSFLKVQLAKRTEWLESFLRVLIQDYLSALLVNSHGVLTALLKCYNTKYSPYPTLNEVN